MKAMTNTQSATWIVTKKAAIKHTSRLSHTVNMSLHAECRHSRLRVSETRSMLYSCLSSICRVALVLFLLHGKVLAQDLSVAIGFSLGPYAISNGRGVLVDVTKKVFEGSATSVRFTYMSNEEALNAFNKGLFDAVTPARPGRGKFCYSDPVVVFHNVVVSLKESNIELNSIRDLVNYRVAAFSGASYFLGQKFYETIYNNEKYIEVARQETQVLMLYRKDVDLIIADRKIFQFYLKTLQKKRRIPATQHSVHQIHDVFPPSVYSLAFHDDKVCDLFNKGLKKLKASGEYDAIFAKYFRLVDAY